MIEQNRLTCQRCLVCFPNAVIIKCQKLTPGGMTMCSTCHKRFHPTCDSHVSVVRHDDRLCDQCLTYPAVYFCPQCSNEKKVLQMCRHCEEVQHSGLYLTHRDHIQTSVTTDTCNGTNEGVQP